MTLHTISQEGSESRGLHATAIKLLDWQARFKSQGTIYGADQEGQGGTGPQRETMVYYFKYLQSPARTQISPPARHREMLAKIYENLAVAVKFLEPSGPTGSGRLAVHYDKTTGSGTIQVDRIGFDTLPEIF